MKYYLKFGVNNWGWETHIHELSAQTLPDAIEEAEDFLESSDYADGICDAASNDEDPMPAEIVQMSEGHPIDVAALGKKMNEEFKKKRKENKERQDRETLKRLKKEYES